MSNKKTLKTFATSIIALSCFFLFVVPVFTAESVKHSCVYYVVCSHANINVLKDFFVETKAFSGENVSPRQVVCCNSMNLQTSISVTHVRNASRICLDHIYESRTQCTNCRALHSQRHWFGPGCPGVLVR